MYVAQTHLDQQGSTGRVLSAWTHRGTHDLQPPDLFEDDEGSPLDNPLETTETSKARVPRTAPTKDSQTNIGQNMVGFGSPDFALNTHGSSSSSIVGTHVMERERCEDEEGKEGEEGEDDFGFRLSYCLCSLLSCKTLVLNGIAGCVLTSTGQSCMSGTRQVTPQRAGSDKAGNETEQNRTRAVPQV